MIVVTPGRPGQRVGCRGNRELLHVIAPDTASGSLLLGRRGSRAGTRCRRNSQLRLLADTICRRSARGWRDRAHQRHRLHRDRNRAGAFPRHRGRSGAERRLDPDGDVRRRVYRYCDAPLSRACGGVGVIGRLAGDTSIDQAHAEVAGLVAAARSSVPRGHSGRRRPGSPGSRHPDAQEQAANVPIVALLAAAAGLVLLVASANVAGLLLARGLRRRKEIAVRLAIGASRGRLIRLLLVESVMLAAAGGVAGLQIAVWATEVLRDRVGAFAQPRPVAGSADRADWFRRRPVHRRGDRDRAGTSVHAARYGSCHERGIVRRRPAALDRA